MVWVYTFNGTAWAQQSSKLVGSGVNGSPFQGNAISLSGDGDTLLSSGYTDEHSVGSTWVFVRSNGAWTQQGAKLVGSGGVGMTRQGFSLSLSGDGSTAIVGGYGDNSNVGAAWVWLRRPAHDFSGDTNSDIAWRNTSGEAGMWLMNGGAMGSTPSLGVIANAWSIVGQRDFNGDGRADILWRNTSHDIGAWFMNGATVSPVGLGNVGSSWFIVGLGDFNGNGTSDILWRSTSNDLGVWLMNGGSYLPIGIRDVGATISVASVGDYNADGKADILLRNTSNDIAMWFMDGATTMSTAGFGNVGPTWLVQNAASN